MRKGYRQVRLYPKLPSMLQCLKHYQLLKRLVHELGHDNVLYLHLTLLPYLPAAGEIKTKPTQHSVKELRSIGIQPDILLCRTDRFLSKDIKAKIALFCNVDPVVDHERMHCGAGRRRCR